MGTLWGPVLGALVAAPRSAKSTRNLFGRCPGLNMVVYGVVLVLIVMFVPRGIIGASPTQRNGATPMRRPEAAWLSRCWRSSGLSIAFGGLRAVQDVSSARRSRALTALIGPNGAGKTTLFALMSGFLKPDAGTVRFDGRRHHRRAAASDARAGMTRTFQIVQPFAGADGAREHRRRRAPATSRVAPRALAAAEQRRARASGSAPQLDKPAGDTDHRRPQAPGAGACAGDAAEAAAARRGAGGPEPAGDRATIVAASSARTPRTGGITVLMIEHVMQAVMNLAEHVVGAGAGPADRRRHAGRGDARPAVIEAYLGHGAAATAAGARMDSSATARRPRSARRLRRRRGAARRRPERQRRRDRRAARLATAPASRR